MNNQRTFDKTLKQIKERNLFIYTVNCASSYKYYITLINHRIYIYMEKLFPCTIGYIWYLCRQYDIVDTSSPIHTYIEVLKM